MHGYEKEVEEFAVGQMIPQQIGYGQNTKVDGKDFREINDAMVDDILKFNESVKEKF